MRHVYETRTQLPSITKFDSVHKENKKINQWLFYLRDKGNTIKRNGRNISNYFRRFVSATQDKSDIPCLYEIEPREKKTINLCARSIQLCRFCLFHKNKCVILVHSTMKTIRPKENLNLLWDVRNSHNLMRTGATFCGDHMCAFSSDRHSNWTVHEHYIIEQ